MRLSLLVAYRNRLDNLQTLINWLRAYGYHDSEKIDVILIEQSSAPEAMEICLSAGINYACIEDDGVFHKSKLLNFALNMSASEFVTPFDVDLVPMKGTLEEHLSLASLCRSSLIAGYRVMHSKSYLSESDVGKIDLSKCVIAPEDYPTALHKQISTHECFGVLPFFDREKLLSLGGWDERFCGWGAEDQDIIERYSNSAALLRSSNLVYVHLNHVDDPKWKEEPLINTNRKYYYSKHND